MCGIAGEVRFDGIVPEKYISHKMAETLRHRGPDGQGLWNDNHVSLSHRRLAIRGLGDTGKQPSLSFNNDIISIFNGEIYNFVELKDQLEKDFGIKIKGECDSEIIPNGYAVWGESLFSMLEGMFAIGLWDRKNKIFHLARDGIGIKPVFYHLSENHLLFGSEIKAIDAVLKNSDQLNLEALHEFITHGYVGKNQTMLGKIKKVPPGSFLTISPNSTNLTSFWRPKRSKPGLNTEDALQNFERIFENSCKSQLVSEVPVGLMLSGGIDSSLIALVLKNEKLPMFTARFKHDEFDEFDKAAAIVNQIGGELTELYCDNAFKIEEDLISVVHHSDGHLADPSALAFYRLSREIRKNCTVAISGDGGDEFFAGYSTYLASLIAEKFGKFFPKNITNKISMLLFYSVAGSHQKYPKLQLAGRFFESARNGSEAHAEWRRFIPSWKYKSLYGSQMKQFIEDDPLVDYKSYIRSSNRCRDAAMEADQSYYLPSNLLLKVDSMSMAHGLEVRVPFLSKEVMDFANGLPLNALTGRFGNTKKRFLKKYLLNLKAPPKLISQKKSGFEIPITSLLNNELSEMCVDLFEQNADLFSPYFVSDEIRKIWEQHKEQKNDYGYVLWTLLTFAIWWRGFYRASGAQ